MAIVLRLSVLSVPSVSDSQTTAFQKVMTGAKGLVEY